MPEDSLGLDKETSSKSNGFNEFLALWSRHLITSTLLLLLVYTASNFAYYGMVVLTSELSNNSRSCASVGAYAHLMQTKDSGLYVNVLVTNFAEFPGLLLASLLVDRVGRKVSLGGLILLCCAFLAPLSIHLEEGLAITLLFYARACSAGSFAVLHAYCPEIYPTSCRNTGVGVTYSVSRVGSMVAPLVTTALLENCRQKEAVLVMNLLLFLTGAACALFPSETKGQQPARPFVAFDSGASPPSRPSGVPRLAAAGMAGGGSGAEACTYTTDEALSRLGFGRFQALLLVFLGTGWVAEAMEVMLLSFVGPSVKAEWGVSGGEEGLITSVVFAGMLAGAWVGGLASDRYGRRAGFLFTALVSGIPGFLCAFSPNYATLLALRFVVGLGLGASHVLPTWFLEFVPAENRGSWIAAFTCSWTVGTILEALLAWAIMPILGWRWLLALSSLPCFILLVFFGLTPESPRYLCSKGKISEAMLVLGRIARINNKVLPPGIVTCDPKRSVDNNHDASVTLLLTPEDSRGINQDTVSKSYRVNEFQALCSRDLIRPTLLLWLVHFGCYFAYYGLLMLISKLSSDNRELRDSRLYINVLVTSFAEFPGLLLASLLIDRIGRKASLGGLILLCCAFLAPLVVQLGEGVAITLLFCARTCVMGSFAVLHVYSPEIYPTSCRNTGVGAANFIGRIASMVAPLVTTSLLENGHQKEAVLTMDSVFFLAAVACALFPLETKGREIQ
ncbi:hypothetical protein EJB05_11686 [Eragrostis curvula]|uniref:Major facilitator superfamily (MFS) profile domain-containing protein n=1 Tax=Eragrostis curvula TaxID=38414 RepID=A0A5J9VQ40_9POAL|nr:hypothetical protein EJB05_11686 [Eragrostis curvula]